MNLRYKFQSSRLQAWFCVLSISSFGVSVASAQMLKQTGTPTTNVVAPGKEVTSGGCNALFETPEEASQGIPATLGRPFRRAPMEASHSADSGVLATLFNDDPHYNSKEPWYIPAIKIVGSEITLWAIDKYIFKYDFSNLSLNSWKHNIDTGFVWDDDRFGINFFFHPYTGGGYFMTARSSGYNYWESIPFAFGGSLLWEYFGETTDPSINDLINTTFNGTFMGEVAYRMTSNILDDSKRGPERAWREVAAGLLSPTRLISRLVDGKAFRVSETEVYEKEPMDASLYVGAHRVNDGTSFATGPIKFTAGVKLDYGNPFEIRDRKPFDHFTFNAELSNAYGRKLLDYVQGAGLVWGSNVKLGGIDALVGVFQHFDYFDNLTFELGDVAIGVGALTRLPISDYFDIYEDLHVSGIPMAGNSNAYGPIDTTQTRDYSYGDGLQILDELGTHLFNRSVGISVSGMYTAFHSYHGVPGNNYIGILRPRITVNVWKNLGIGFEHFIYWSSHNSASFSGYNLKQTEQKLFLQWTWDDFRKD